MVELNTTSRKLFCILMYLEQLGHLFNLLLLGIISLINICTASIYVDVKPQLIYCSLRAVFTLVSAMYLYSLYLNEQYFVQMEKRQRNRNLRSLFL